MKRILIVDDETSILDFLEARLEANQFEVIRATNGEEAIHKAAENHVDLVILDWVMPMINGLTICKLFKMDDKMKNIPIIILTARPQEDKEAFEGFKPEAYVTKPYNPEELITTINKFIS